MPRRPIEDEPRDLVKNTGKDRNEHKAGVVGDTVGDRSRILLVLPEPDD